MGLCPDRCRVIGEHRENPVELVPDSPDNPVHLLNSLYFFLDTPEMPCLIRCLDMDVNKIEMFDCVKGILAFAS